MGPRLIETAPADRPRSRCSSLRPVAGGADEIYLLASGIIQVKRSAQLLQTVAGEVRENLIHTSTSRTGERVNELGLDAAIGNLQLVVLGIRAELLGSELGKNGALRWHGSLSPLLLFIAGRGSPRHGEWR